MRSGCTAGFPTAIARGDLDLTIYSAAPLEGQGPLFSEPTHRVAGPGFERNATLLQIALYDRDHPWREQATAALDRAGIAWRLAYLGQNFTSVKAAIAAGLAVGFLARSAIDEGFTILAADEGFPPLPATRLSSARGAATTRVAGEMEKALRSTVL